MIDQAASARGDENTATPREAMMLMEKLFRGEVVSRSLRDDALKILKLRKNSPIPRLLPANVEIANKPGGIEGVACDWAVVFVPNRPYAIAVMLSRSTKYGARVPLELLKNRP
jgi:beta-lactamase class A